jgi:small-conductance mechanosensitive channel
VRRGLPAWPLVAVLALVVLAIAAAGAWAQTPAEVDAARQARWTAAAESADETVNDQSTSTEALEQLREQLVKQRSEALAAEQERQPPVNELNQRLQALGPAPAEGAEEAPEIATLRRDLNDKLSQAQAPVLAAQEAYRRTDALIGSIDRIIRARFSAELLSRGPSPLRPGTWLSAAEELTARAGEYRRAVAQDFSDPVVRERVLMRAPFYLLLIAAGVAAAFWVRNRTLEIIERRLSVDPVGKSAAAMFALRNLVPLMVPVVAAGLVFAAFDPSMQRGPGRFFSLPSFVLVLIAAGWLAASLFAPVRSTYRLLPLSDEDARKAVRVTMLIGSALAAAYLFNALALSWNLTATTQTALQFPLVLVGALGLWRLARFVTLIEGRIGGGAGAGARLDPTTATIIRRSMQVAARLIRIIAVVAPLLAAAGYLPAAGFLVFRSAMTLALFGGAYVIFDVLNNSVHALLRSPKATPEDNGGLLPVVFVALVVAGALPLLAMIWGARPSDIADSWTMLREGVTLGGIRLSASAVLTLVLVFGVGVAVVRLLQTVLRGTVLPRTKLDAGSRNAVLAGVGYVGFAVSGLAAVSAAGLNLASLAIVAGALSVGIGFGMQNIVSNFVSGIILLVERPVKEGDWIEVGGFAGYVRGINVRSTVIETFDRASVILPNSDLIAGTVLNRTHSGMSGRLQVPISVTYDTDPKKVETILLDIAETHPLVLMEPTPRVLLLELGADAMSFELRCWLRDVNFSLSARSDMNFEIIERFRQAGIRIPFYGRDMPPLPPAPPEPPVIPEPNPPSQPTGS